MLVPADPVGKASREDRERQMKLGIEVMALYSYNLHESTFHGLEALESRKGKRNFNLGRGSLDGMYRYAGLWSGDNASTWEFGRITIPQVLSLGLNGVCISGSDKGGFEPNGLHQYCDRQLLIRWYAGSFLLPWLRNDYNCTKDNGRAKKWFQVCETVGAQNEVETNMNTEHWQYPMHFEKNRGTLHDQGYLYYGVQYIAKFFLDLRYSSLQLLFDAKFENHQLSRAI